MPTVILLDVSLSMCRHASRRTATSNLESNRDGPVIKALATAGVGILCDYFSQNSQLEHVSLVVFSSLYEIRHAFSRDFDSIKSSAHSLEVYDKSNIVNALRGVHSMKLDEWSQDGPVNIILITDGQLYNTDMHVGDGIVDNDIDYEFRDIPLRELNDLFNFDCKLQVVCLTSPRDPALKQSLGFYKKLVSIVDSSTRDCPILTGSNLRNYKRSAVWLPESSTLDISREEVESIFVNIAELNYKPYNVTLSCGHLSSLVLLSPKPTDCLVEPLKNEFDDLKNEESQLAKDNKDTYVSALNKKCLFELSEEINICGFLPMSEVASPAIKSRHIVFPIPNSRFNETLKAEQILSQDPNAYNKSLQTCPIEQEPMSSNKREEKSGKSNTSKSRTSVQSPSADNYLEKDITKRPSFCVLLHSCLKQENMVAVCVVGKNDETNEDWFGILHPHTDAKKKSSLMLSFLLPGPNPILWLPNFRTLGSATLNQDLPPAILERLASGSGTTNTSTEGKSCSKSYSTNNVIWLDPESVQMDVQKIVRHAKRAPEKAPHFYRELNRIRRAAISYGFYDVLYGLASILEREKRTMLSDQARPANMEVIKHIDHVVASLRVSLDEKSFETNIIPPVV